MNKVKRHCGKKIAAARVALGVKKLYTFSEALDLLKENNFVSFDPTVEFVIKLGIDVKRSDQNVRGRVVQPLRSSLHLIYLK